jgi:hypothetical protein
MPLTLPLDASECDEVRAAIDVSLDANTLPDSIINMAIYAGAALRFVVARTLNSDEFARQALLFVTAANCMPAIPKIVSETIAGGSYSRQSEDWVKREAWLRTEADASIAQSELLNATITVTSTVTDTEMPFEFGVV